MFLLLVLAIAVFLGGVLWSESRRSGPMSLSALATYLAAVVRRNLPLPEALRAYAGDLCRQGDRMLLETIASHVEEGGSLADALDRNAARFPAGFRALVRAGERGGNLATVLEGSLQTLDLDERLHERAVLYSTYPILVVSLTASAYVAGSQLIGPIAVSLLQDVGARPSSGFPSWLGEVLAFSTQILFALYVLSILRRWMGVRLDSPVLAAIRWRLPILGRFERHQSAARFSLVASRLLESGIPVPEAVRLAGAASGQRRFSAIARDAAAAVEEGEPFAAALGRADRRREIPAALLWYATQGESAGALEVSLAQAADHSFARSRIGIEAALRTILPIGVLAAAVAVGTMGWAMVDTAGILIDALRAWGR